MNVKYFEVWEERFGTKETKTVNINATTFAMMLTLHQDNEFDLLGDLITSFEEEEGFFVLAMNSAFCDNKRIAPAIKTKGWWAKEWEEGSHGFALPGCEKDCKRKIRDIESRIENARWGW